MNFADKLKNHANDTKRTTIKAKQEKVGTQRATNKKDFANILRKNTEQKTEPNVNLSKSDLGTVKKWSFSGLKNFERCPMSVKLDKVDHEPQKQGDAAERGSAIHDMCEQFVRGQVPSLIPDRKTKFGQFARQFSDLKALFERNEKGEEGLIEMEENWGIRLDWSGCSWEDKELWGRAKLDVFIRESETSCRIIDYKTGRKFGNEMKHADQGLSYALYAYHRFNKEIEHFTTEFWYLDQGLITTRNYSAKQLEILHPRMHRRAIEMTTTTNFKAKPNADTCRFCSYGANKNKQGVAYGTGVCPSDFYREMGDYEDPAEDEGNQEL